jgi:carbon-monoxide dehydrogenase large subunit
VDPEIGEIKLLKHWVVEDCGVAINPLLVDEQIRGGVIQGIGAALYEHCIYSEDGQLTNGNFMDYLVPMASEMPDIEIAHTCTPTKTSDLGAKGAGEAGVAGASAAVLNAVNDALSTFNVSLNAIPITPQNIIQKLYKFDGK